MSCLQPLLSPFSCKRPASTFQLLLGSSSVEMPSLPLLLPLLPLPLVLLLLYKIISPNPPPRSPSASSTSPSSSSSSSSSLPTLLLRLTTAHKRLLPTPAQHAFGYPLLYFGVDLEDMEEKRIEKRAQLLPTWFFGGFGVKVFGYRRENDGGKKVWEVTRLEESGYLSPSLEGQAVGAKNESGKEEIEKVSFPFVFFFLSFFFFFSPGSDARQLDSTYEQRLLVYTSSERAVSLMPSPPRHPPPSRRPPLSFPVLPTSLPPTSCLFPSSLTPFPFNIPLTSLFLYLSLSPIPDRSRPPGPTPSPQTHPSPLYPPLLLPFNHRSSPRTRLPHHHACLPRHRRDQPSLGLVVLREGTGGEGEEVVDGFVGGS